MWAQFDGCNVCLKFPKLNNSSAKDNKIKLKESNTVTNPKLILLQTDRNSHVGPSKSLNGVET